MADVKDLEKSNIYNLPVSEKVANQSWRSKFGGTSILASEVGALSEKLGSSFSNTLGNDTEAGRIAGTAFSTMSSSLGNTLSNNLIKGLTLTSGLGKNMGSSLAGAGMGLAANYLGLGVTSAMGNSRLAKGIGAGLSTGLGTIGGTLATNGFKLGSTFATGNAGFLSSAAGTINPYALGATVLGSALGAAAGPSKEYAGKHGSITRTMDTIYDVASIGANAIPVAGLAISAAMVLNKGLSNMFGSTDGMTKTDAILGSAFMPAPVKWMNMWGSSTTGTFNDLSWQNSEKTSKFMLDGFGNLQSRFDLAREEAGKTYGTFSLGAKRRALDNIDYANNAWNMVLKMANLNALQNIKSLDMSSINNLRYAQMIQGGSDPRTLIGRQGMKILNNATNHNIGMRLLSGAALIDNKQMILCNVPD